MSPAKANRARATTDGALTRPPQTFSASTLRVGRADDAFEREADRAAERMSGRPRPGVRTAPPAGERRVDAAAERYIRDPGSGQRLPDGVRVDAERALGWSFGNVRIHADARAAGSARRMGARAFTHGRDIVFGSGRYAPHTHEGRRLITHELTHVVQQGAAGGVVQRSPSYGVPAPAIEGELRPELEDLRVEPGIGAPEVQADDEEGTPPPVEPTPEAPVELEGEGGGTPQPTQPAGPATPTLAVAPGAALTRGQQLTANVNFTPNAGETLRVTGWRYTSDEHGTVNRVAREAARTQWQGTMAAGGELQARYRITPAGGTEGTEEELTSAITVNDRSGGTWQSAVTENAEGQLGGQPAPPRRFNQLGRHNGNIALPALTPATIADGPNKGMRFVESLQPGTYTSTPSIHPDLLDPASTFMTFHAGGSRLYHVNGATRTLIPGAEYSNLSLSPALTFDVPDWETFYKAHGYFRVSATSGNTTVALQDAWWGLDANSRNASLEVRADAAIRNALNIPATEGYTLSAAPQGSFEGFILMTGAGVLAGTRSHEFQHAVHSHRANFRKMMRALDPQKKIESRVQGIGGSVNFNTLMTTWRTEILKPNHEIVDEAASETAEAFVADPSATMAGVNQDPSSGNVLGSVWNITGDREMT